MFRLLITGSRSWVDENAIIEQFRLVYAKYGSEVTLVSGACKDGADALCEKLAVPAGWVIERHPADWKTYGKPAGFKRNEQMVELGADACLAFIKDRSKGATHTANLAEKAGIWTRRIVQDTVEEQDPELDVVDYDIEQTELYREEVQADKDQATTTVETEPCEACGGKTHTVQVVNGCSDCGTSWAAHVRHFSPGMESRGCRAHCTCDLCF